MTRTGMRALRRAASLESFGRQPAGQYVAGPTWVHAGISEELFVVLLFGSPTQEDVRALVRSLMTELDPAIPPHRSLVDASRLLRADLGAFGELSAYVRAEQLRLSRSVTRLALVRPDGMQGAVVAGFYQVLEAPYPVVIVDEVVKGLEQLGIANAGAITAVFDPLIAKVTGTPSVVSLVRAYASGDLAGATVEAAARSLGLATRTLQRHLERAGTTFQEQLLEARLDEAERRMLDSADPLTTIALDSGFATLQHFSSAFRERAGQSPSAWRSARRGGEE